MKRCVITGGAGFIGSNLARRLVAEGVRVTVVDNLSTGFLANLAGLEKAIDFIEGDVRDRGLMRQACRGAAAVFHQAAIASVQASVEDPAGCHEVNVGGTLSVLLAAREAGARRVVLASSSSVYGDAATLPLSEETPLRPLSPYAVTKRCGEDYCRVFSELFGLDTVALRYFNVFGPRHNPASEYAAVIPKFILAALRGESPVIHGDGEQSRDFVFVEDVVQANLLAARQEERLGGQAFNVGTGAGTSLNGLIQDLGWVLGRPVRARYAAPRQGDIRHSLADPAGARQRLGFTASHSFREGLRLTVDWYARQTSGREGAEVAAAQE